MTVKKKIKPKAVPVIPEAPSIEPQIIDTSPPAARFPIVGIGASAGGLAAFEAFFSAMPADVDTGMAFVLVQHLAPDHKSILTELIRRYTRMRVSEVVDGMTVEPNCAYIPSQPGHGVSERFPAAPGALLTTGSAAAHRFLLSFAGG